MGFFKKALKHLNPMNAMKMLPNPLHPMDALKNGVQMATHPLQAAQNMAQHPLQAARPDMMANALMSNPGNQAQASPNYWEQQSAAPAGGYAQMGTQQAGGQLGAPVDVARVAGQGLAGYGAYGGTPPAPNMGQAAAQQGALGGGMQPAPQQSLPPAIPAGRFSQPQPIPGAQPAMAASRGIRGNVA